MKQALKMVFGSCVVYVVMAACAAKEKPQHGNGNGNDDSGRGGMLASGGAGAGGMANGGTQGGLNASGGLDAGAGRSGGAGRDDAGRDAGPVPDAMAQDSGTEPQVDTVPCTTMIPGNTGFYAEKTYPGTTVLDLANLRALGVFTTAAATDSGSTHEQANARLADGVARVFCGPAAVQVYASVVFIRP